MWGHLSIKAYPKHTKNIYNRIAEKRIKVSQWSSQSQTDWKASIFRELCINETSMNWTDVVKTNAPKFIHDNAED